MLIRLETAKTYVHPDGKVYKKFADDGKSRNFYDVTDAYGKVLLSQRDASGIQYFRTYTLPVQVNGPVPAVIQQVKTIQPVIDHSAKGTTMTSEQVFDNAKPAGRVSRSFGRKKEVVTTENGEIDTGAGLIAGASVASSFEDGPIEDTDGPAASDDGIATEI